ncbi:MAG: glycogen debranching enzyme N-terminal domain-containing protein, partial [Acidobacteriales bacterium]|nr:glycogen debranching enzyme N-terminal domain-containing protein [Terriglobales bacterium]
MSGPVRLIYRRSEQGDQDLSGTEWLVTNGLGGYASGTISGVVTRRYHGYLIAALPSPHGRVIMLNQLSEQLKFADHQRYDLGGLDDQGHLIMHGVENLIEFRVENGLPVWTFNVRDVTVEKRVWMAHRQNTVFVQYRVQGGTVALRLTPAVHFRYHDSAVSENLNQYIFTADGKRYQIQPKNSEFPPMRLYLHGEEASFTVFGRTQTEQLYPIEESRGYEYKGQLWSPGHFWADISPEHPATLVASSESWDTFMALGPAQAEEFEELRRSRMISCSD